MNPQLFVEKYLPCAQASYLKKGIHPLAILVQAAIESAWGSVCPGNMFFGQKDTDGINGNEQLLTTTEYHLDATHKYPQILGIVPVVLNGKRMFKYTIKDWFRKYPTPEDCFNDHCDFFYKNSRYAKALAVKNDPEKFLMEVAAAGYATDPNYSKTLLSVLRTIQKYVPNS